MKISQILICTVILALSASVISSAPTYDLVYNTSWLIDPPTAYSNGIFYIGNNAYYNVSSGQVKYVYTVANCSTYPFLSANIVPWCVSISNDQTRFAVSQLDAGLNKIVATYPLTIPESSYHGFIVEFSGNYLNIYSYVYNNTYFYYNLIFDTVGLTFVCPNAYKTSPVYHVAQWYTNSSFIYVDIDADYNSHYHYVNCATGVDTETNSTGIYSDQDVFGFNSSSVFINYYTEEINGIVKYHIRPFINQSTSTFFFGTSEQILSFNQVNDTHFLSTKLSNDLLEISLNVITQDLTFVKVKSFIPGISKQDNPEVVPIVGTTLATVAIGQSSNAKTEIVYDYTTNEIVKAFASYPPIVLSNGSEINITSFGYFIQTPGQKAHFVSAPGQDDIQYFPGNQLYASLFISSGTSKHCSLLTIYTQTNQVSLTNFSSCPATQSTLYTPTLKDVINLDGIFTILYKDSLNYIYIVNQTKTLGPFSNAQVLTFPSFALNLTTGTVDLIGGQVAGGFKAASFYINNGSTFRSTVFVAGTYDYTYKLTQRYVLLGASNSIETTFTVWDLSDFKSVSQFTVQLSIGYSVSNVPFVALGVDESQPSIFSGIVTSSSTTTLALINPQGQIQYVNGTNYVSQVLPSGPNSFFCESTTTYLEVVSYFEITSWSLEGDYIVEYF